MRRFFTFLLGTTSGAIVGAAIALLIAPASGEELRTRARERFADLRDELKEAYETRSTQLQAELDEMRKRKAPEQVA